MLVKDEDIVLSVMVFVRVLVIVVVSVVVGVAVAVGVSDTVDREYVRDVVPVGLADGDKDAVNVWLCVRVKVSVPLIVGVNVTVEGVILSVDAVAVKEPVDPVTVGLWVDGDTVVPVCVAVDVSEGVFVKDDVGVSESVGVGEDRVAVLVSVRVDGVKDMLGVFVDWVLDSVGDEEMVAEENVSV